MRAAHRLPSREQKNLFVVVIRAPLLQLLRRGRRGRVVLVPLPRSVPSLVKVHLVVRAGVHRVGIRHRGGRVRRVQILLLHCRRRLNRLNRLCVVVFRRRVFQQQLLAFVAQ